METVKGFKSHNRCGEEIIAGPWRYSDGTLRYVRKSKGGDPCMTFAYGDGHATEYGAEHEHDLIPLRREVKGSDLKPGDKILFHELPEFNRVTDVCLCFWNPRHTRWTPVLPGKTYFVEDKS